MICDDESVIQKQTRFILNVNVIANVIVQLCEWAKPLYAKTC